MVTQLDVEGSAIQPIGHIETQVHIEKDPVEEP